MNSDQYGGELETRRRVKVYRLNDEGQWDDVGTGHVSCVHHKVLDALALVVKSEEKGSETILESKIQSEDIYQLQQDTLIVWQEPETGLDLALSFQEEQGCKEVWEQICAVQGRNPSESSDEVVTEEENNSIMIKLPPVNLTNLDKVNSAFEGEHNAHTKERLATSVTRDGYLEKLIELFHVIEESGNQEQLHTMFNIFKNLVLLNDPALLELLFNDQNYMATVGALEYDREVSPKLEHRRYLQNSVVFKEVVPISNTYILKKIHHTFRIQYLKDVILPRLLDDLTFATINSLIYFSNVEIVDQLYKDGTFLTDLFSKFKTATKEELVDLLGFLQEFCSLAKNLQIPQQREVYQALAQYGLFEIFESALSETNIKIRLSCADLMNHVLSHDPVLFRQSIIAQTDHPLLRNLINRAVSESDIGLLSQFTEIIRILVDTETMEETPEKERFLTLFYQTFMKGLMAPIMDVDSDKEKRCTSSDPGELELEAARRQELCELLAYCCQHHGHHIKFFILGNHIASKVAKLLSSTQPKHVSLAALRFFRALVAAKDDWYNRYIIKWKLFDPIVQLFVANGSKYNLINSAVIELFDYIRKENIKRLLTYVVECYGDVFKEVDYVETFRLLQLRYEQNKDYEQNINRAFSEPTKSPQRTTSDDVEDSYFFGDDEDEEPIGLVAYGEAQNEKESIGSLKLPIRDENGEDTVLHDFGKKRKRAEGQSNNTTMASATAETEVHQELHKGDNGKREQEGEDDNGDGGMEVPTAASSSEEHTERDSKRLKFAIQTPKLRKITSDS